MSLVGRNYNLAACCALGYVEAWPVGWRPLGQWRFAFGCVRLLLATAYRLLGWWCGRVPWPTWPRKLPLGEAGQGGLRMAGQREERT